MAGYARARSARGHPAALAQAVRTQAGDPALRERLGAAGYLYAQAHLDRDAVLQRFEADVRGLLLLPGSDESKQWQAQDNKSSSGH